MQGVAERGGGVKLARAMQAIGLAGLALAAMGPGTGVSGRHANDSTGHISAHFCPCLAAFGKPRQETVAWRVFARLLIGATARLFRH